MVTKVTKNHLPGFSTLASNSVIGGAEGGSLLITSDGTLANHTHYSALMALLLYHRSNRTVVFVPPNPLVTLDQLPMVDWMAAGKCTVTLEHPLSILLNWLVFAPKLEAVSAGKDSEVREVHLRKALPKALPPLAVVNELRSTEAREVQLLKALLNALLPLTVVNELRSTEVREEQY